MTIKCDRKIAGQGEKDEGGCATRGMRSEKVNGPPKRFQGRGKNVATVSVPGEFISLEKDRARLYRSLLHESPWKSFLHICLSFYSVGNISPRTFCLFLWFAVIHHCRQIRPWWTMRPRSQIKQC